MMNFQLDPPHIHAFLADVPLEELSKANIKGTVENALPEVPLLDVTVANFIPPTVYLRFPRLLETAERDAVQQALDDLAT